MHAIGNFITEHSNKKVLYTTSDMFMNDYTGIANLEKGQSAIDYANNFKNKYRNVDVLIIDDIQYLVGAEKTQQEFFHTFNALHQANKQIIISSDRSPDDLKILEERIRSRFMWGLPVDIYPPDFDLRCRIIKQKIKNTSIADKLDENVIEFIANSCQNDVRFLEGALNRLMAYTAMIVPDKIDLEFANEALKDFINKNIYSENSIDNIQKAVADYYNITVEDLKGKKRSANIAYPRQIGMYLSRVLTEETFPRIGLEFGGRDHSTVIHACDKITSDIHNNKKLEYEINEIKNKI
jgi:chromosomal replication initiator protein